MVSRLPPLTREQAREIVRQHDEKHPPEPLPPEVERELVKLWGPMKLTTAKPKQ